MSPGLADRLPELYKLFGLEPAFENEALEQAYKRLRGCNQQNAAAIRLRYKILKDPFLKRAARFYTVSELLAAGFFDDGVEPEQIHEELGDSNWFATPVYRIAKTLADAHHTGPERLNKTPVVLLTTGAFAPFHDGHLQMMLAARQALQNRGFWVIGGYVSPSHDAYVQSKDSQAKMWTWDVRLTQCENAVFRHNWLLVDSWESRCCAHSVPYTTVMLRLQDYLCRHLPVKAAVEVVYVFGGDNACFARTFVGMGRCVCVGRPGFESIFNEVAADPAVSGCPNIIMVPVSEQSHDVCSTAIRACSMDPAESPVVSKVLLRDDLSFAVAPWCQGRTTEVLQAARDHFFGGLKTALQEGLGNAICLEVLAAQEQQKRLDRLLQESAVINLDAVTNSPIKLHLSRVFELAGPQKMALCLESRPGHSSLLSQLQAIPAGPYVLVDDDMASGETVATVLKQLPPFVRVVCVKALAGHDVPQGQGAGVDFIDARDFLVGACEAGLVVALANGSLARAPYLWPYVRLNARGSIPLVKEEVFSRQVWALNKVFFACLSPPVLLAETNEAFQRLMLSLGFELTTRLVDICDWHVAHFG